MATVLHITTILLHIHSQIPKKGMELLCGKVYHLMELRDRIAQFEKKRNNVIDTLIG